jgi:FMN phosphatase YigB (HAD superfamily)
VGERSLKTRMPRNRDRVTKAVVFDLGGVLIDLHSIDARRELIDDYGMPAERFDRLTRSCFTAAHRSITELAMVGKASTSEYLASFSRACLRNDVEGIKRNRLSVIGRERPAIFEIVDELRQRGLICCILSNTIALHWEKLGSSREYPLLASIDRIFASHLMARAKPRRNAFSFVADALKLRMSECLLVDDTPLNVERARAAGWRGVLFKDGARLRDELDTVTSSEMRENPTAFGSRQATANLRC